MILKRFSVFVRNIGEMTLHRPFLPRDHILKASSMDGLRWQKDEHFRLVHPSVKQEHMNYFCTIDQTGNLWWRASVHDSSTGLWHTELTNGHGWIDVRSLGLQHLYSPSWCGKCLYGVGETPDGEREIVCLQELNEGWPRHYCRQTWNGMRMLGRIEDVTIVQLGDHDLRAWCSIAESPTSTSIHMWRSSDGSTWDHDGVAVSSPHQGHWYQLAANPSLVRLDGNRWRLYFRTGRQPALGNEIVSATSIDLEAWQHDVGTRLAPGGRWDTHGVGFPLVIQRQEPPFWQMYYTGYWGQCSAAAKAAAVWQQRANELRVRHEQSPTG